MAPTLDSVRSTLILLQPELKRDWAVKHLGVFGSVANREANETSDVDILVEFAQTPGWEFFDLADLLEAQLRRKVDLTTPGGLHPRLAEGILQNTVYIF